MILERGVEIAEQDGPLPRGSHIVLNDVAIIAAGKARGTVSMSFGIVTVKEKCSIG